jgi:hypothetical protein
MTVFSDSSMGMTEYSVTFMLWSCVRLGFLTVMQNRIYFFKIHHELFKEKIISNLMASVIFWNPFSRKNFRKNAQNAVLAKTYLPMLLT